MRQKVIIKNVQGYYDGVRKFIVVPVNEEVREELSDFCDVPSTDECLFTISKFASTDVADGLVPDEFVASVGSVIVSAKLEPVEYDWTYKGKKGHTKKWQVCGLVFKSHLLDTNLEGLDDD